MVVEYVRYPIPEEQQAAFVDAYKAAQASLRASPQCLSYELTRCVEAPDQYVVRIEWDSMPGHLEGFREGPEFPAFLAAVRPYIGQIQEMRHYEQVLQSE